MKAKKTSPKSIRFNKKDLDISLHKSGLESIQELVDFLLNEYAKGINYPVESIISESVSNISRVKGKDYAPNVHEVQKEVDKVVLSSKKEQLERLIKAPATKGYFHGAKLPDFDPEVGHEGISDSNLPY